jgi:hypothetical protein
MGGTHADDTTEIYMTTLKSQAGKIHQKYFNGKYPRTVQVL